MLANTALSRPTAPLTSPAFSLKMTNSGRKRRALRLAAALTTLCAVSATVAATAPSHADMFSAGKGDTSTAHTQPQPAQATKPARMHPALAPFMPLVGHTLRTQTEAFTDTQTWRWINDGQGILIEHAVGDGAYAGTTLVHYDPMSKSVVFRYATTAGFYTDGTLDVESSDPLTYSAIEHITGTADGIAEVASSAHFDGAHLVVQSKFLKDGVWSEASTNSYSFVK